MALIPPLMSGNLEKQIQRPRCVELRPQGVELAGMLETQGTVYG